nr:translation initiation factor IF-2-like [Saimiri boliviensis boliviensis]
MGARYKKREGRKFEALPGLGSPRRRCGSVQPHGFERGPDVPASERPVESPAGAHFQPRPRPAAPGQVRRVGSARLFFCVRSTHDAPALRTGAEARVVAPSATPSHSTERRGAGRGGKGSGLLTDTGEGRSARCGAWLPSGDPRAHHGWPCVAKFKLSLRECLLQRRSAAASGLSAKRGGGDLRAEERRPSWERGRRGCALGAPGRGGSGESSLGCARGGAPGGSSPGASGPGPGVWKRPRNEGLLPPPAQGWPRWGVPLWAGYQLGGRTERRRWSQPRGAGGSALPSRALRRSRWAVRCSLRPFPRET